MDILKQLIALVLPWLIMFNFRGLLEKTDNDTRYLLMHIPGIWGIIYFLIYNHVYCKHTLEMYTQYEQAISSSAPLTTVLHNPYILAVIYYLFLSAKILICGLIVYNIQVFYNIVDLFIGLAIYGLLFHGIGTKLYNVFIKTEKRALIFSIVCLSLIVLELLMAVGVIIDKFIGFSDIRYTLSDLRDRIPVKRRGLSARELDKEWDSIFLEILDLESKLDKVKKTLFDVRELPGALHAQLNSLKEDVNYTEREINTLNYHRNNHQSLFHNYPLDEARLNIKIIRSDLEKEQKEASHLLSLSQFAKQEDERIRKEEHRRTQEEKKRREKQEQRRREEEQRRREYEQRQYEQKRQDQRKTNGSNHEAHSFFDGCKDMDTLNARYKKLAKLYHPDSGIGSEETFKILQEEYEKLKKQIS